MQPGKDRTSSINLVLNFQVSLSVQLPSQLHPRRKRNSRFSFSFYTHSTLKSALVCTEPIFPDGKFCNFRASNPSIEYFYVLQKHRLADFETFKLRRYQSGRKRGKACYPNDPTSSSSSIFLGKYSS